jgi:hypothetical protein
LASDPPSRCYGAAGTDALQFPRFDSAVTNSRSQWFIFAAAFMISA